MEPVQGPDGDRLYVDRREGKRGEKGPFYVVYADEGREDRWGFYCGNCDSVETAVDTMGRIQCNECRNRAKPEVWDAAHE